MGGGGSLATYSTANVLAGAYYETADGSLHDMNAWFAAAGGDNFISFVSMGNRGGWNSKDGAGAGTFVIEKATNNNSDYVNITFYDDTLADDNIFIHENILLDDLAKGVPIPNSGTDDVYQIGFFGSDPDVNGRVGLLLHEDADDKIRDLLYTTGATDSIIIKSYDVSYPWDGNKKHTEIKVYDDAKPNGDNKIGSNFTINYVGGTSTEIVSTEVIDGQVYHYRLTLELNGVHYDYTNLEGVHISIDYDPTPVQTSTGIGDTNIRIKTPYNRNEMGVIGYTNGTAAGINNVWANGDAAALYGAEFTFSILDSVDTKTLIDKHAVSTLNSIMNRTNADISDMVTFIESSRDGYLEIEFLSDATVATAGTTFDANFTFVNALTGERRIIINPTSLASDKPFSLDFDNGVKFDFDIASSTTNNVIKAGDKLLYSINGNTGTFDAATDVYVTLDMNGASSGPIMIKNGLTQGAAITGVSLDGGKFNEAGLKWQVDGTVTLGESVGIELYSGDPNAPAPDDDSDVTDLRYLRLKNLVAFRDLNGHSMLDGGRSFSIYGNGKYADVFLSGEDTILDLTNKLRTAIINDLGMGSNDPFSGAVSISPELLVQLITSSETNPSTIGAGVILFQSALFGTQSELTFLAENDLLNAMGITQIQKAKNNITTTSVANMNTGEYVGGDISSDGILRGAIKNVDVQFDPNGDVVASYDSTSGRVVYTARKRDDVYLTIAKNATENLIGANAGQTADISLPQVDSTSLEINDLNVLTSKNAQKSTERIDRAIDRLRHIRTTTMAKANALDYQIESINYTSMHLRHAEASVLTPDIATDHALIVRNKILSNIQSALNIQFDMRATSVLDLLHFIDGYRK